MNRLFRYLSLVSVCTFLSASLLAQDATGRVAGVITDPSGAVVPGAAVTVTNVGTNLAKTVVTDAHGFYEVRQLNVGNYKAAVEAAGFSKTESKPAALDINQTLRVDLKLEVGNVSQTVTVESQGSAVETQNSAVGGTVTGQAIYELPLNGRDTLDLLATQPGVTLQNPDNGAAGKYSIAGGRTDSVTYLLDGGLNNDLLNNGVVVDPNPDAVAEFRVIESNYSAEYGRNAGGIVSVVTKSGTNSLHGTAYDYARNEFFNANDFFLNQQGQPRQILKRQQYGGTIGGPVVIPKLFNGRNKLFFFFSYEGQKQNQLNILGKSQTFTPAEANGDFSQAVNGGPDPNVVAYLQGHPYYQPDPTLASQGIIDPSKIDPVAKAYFAAGLIPTSTTGYLFPTAPELDNRNDYLGRFDYSAGSNDTITGTFTAHDRKFTSAYLYATVNGYLDASSEQSYSGTLTYTHLFTPTILNEARINAVRTTPTQDVPALNLPGPSQLGINITPDVVSGPPMLFFNGSGLTTGFSYQGPTKFANTVYAFYDNVSWTKGKHNTKYGFFFSPYQNNTQYAYFVNGAYTFYGPSTSIGSGTDFADFLLGLPDLYNQAGNALSNIRTHQYAGYAQDEWHVTPRLTLTLGIRYEYAQPKYDTQGRSTTFLAGAHSTRFPNAPTGFIYPGDKGAPKGVNFPDKNDWAPRFGFAWDVFGNAKTAIRGGFGVFYDVLKGEDNLQFNGSPPFYAGPAVSFNAVDPVAQAGPSGYLSDPFGTNSTGTPNGFPSRPPASNVDYAPFEPLGSGGGLYLVDSHLRTPYVYQYNFSIQQELFAGTTLELGYVGNDSHKLTSLVDINPFPLGSLTRLYNPDPSNSIFSYLYQFQNVSNANYNSMQVNLTKRSGETKLGSVFYTFAYTWGHEIDNASGFRERNSFVPYYNHNAFRASGDADVRQTISLSGGWDLPFERAWQRGPKLLTKGWSLYPIVSWRTGFPLDISAGLSTATGDPGPAGDGAAGIVHADQVLPGVATYNPRNVQTLAGNSGNFFFNPAAFSNARLNALDTQSQIDPSVLVGSFTEGTFPRNGLRGPGFINTDVTLSKHLVFSERYDAELRLDAFNVFNHTNFNKVDVNINSGTFGQATTAAAPRILQVALHFKF